MIHKQAPRNEENTGEEYLSKIRIGQIFLIVEKRTPKRMTKIMFIMFSFIDFFIKYTYDHSEKYYRSEVIYFANSI